MSIKITSQAINLNGLVDKILASKNKLTIGFLDAKQAQIAAKMEYGGDYPVTDEYKARGEAKGFKMPKFIGIPARPFMQNTVTNKKSEWAKVAILTTKNNGGDIEQSLNLVGRRARNDILATIEEGEFIPNSQRTIEIKDKESPLIDTGEMSRSVAWEVTK